MIYFVAPDIARPSGGVRTIYKCVDLLNGAGAPAAVLHSRRGFRCDWFDNSTIVEHTPVTLRGGDVLVVPEYLTARLASIAVGIRKLVFNQNAYRTFLSGSEATDVMTSIAGESCDIVGVLVVSDDNARYLTYAFPGIPVTRVHHWIDADVFSVEAAKSAHSITVMPRKRRDDYEQLTAMLDVRGRLTGWEFDVVEGRPEREVAVALRRSPLFVSLARAEGFGLPAAEAIACGCHVIGFHGMGGRELFDGPWAEAIEDGDVVGVARAIEAFAARYETHRDEADALGAQGVEFIRSTYTRERATEDLIGCFAPLLDEPDRAVEAVVAGADLRTEPRIRRALRHRLQRIGRRL